MRILKLVIEGRPITKKNSQMIVTPRSKKDKEFPNFNSKKVRSFLIPKKVYRNYEKDACVLILAQVGGGFDTIEGNVHIQALYWMPNKKGWPDLLGVEESTADILEKASIIKNDKNIISWDGSRIMGVDPENPRVEITIRWG